MHYDTSPPWIFLIPPAKIPHRPPGSWILGARLSGFQIILAFFRKICLQAVYPLPLRQHAIRQEYQDVIKFVVDTFHHASHSFGSTSPAATRKNICFISSWKLILISIHHYFPTLNQVLQQVLIHLLIWGNSELLQTIIKRLCTVFFWYAFISIAPFQSQNTTHILIYQFNYTTSKLHLLIMIIRNSNFLFRTPSFLFRENLYTLSFPVNFSEPKNKRLAL